MIRNILIAVAAGILFAVIAGAVNSYIFPGIIPQAFLTAGFGVVVGVVFVVLHTRKKTAD
jgi:hypothetical protein